MQMAIDRLTGASTWAPTGGSRRFGRRYGGAGNGEAIAIPSAAEVNAVSAIAQQATNHESLQAQKAQWAKENILKLINLQSVVDFCRWCIFFGFMILAFVLLFKGGSFAMRKARSNKRRRNMCKYARGGCKARFGPWTLPFGGGTGPTADPFGQYRTYDADSYTMVQDRKARSLGRCDNERYVEMSGVRSLKNKNDPRNVCADMALLPNIEWDVSPEKKNSEWNKIPPALRQLIKKFNIVIIPFKIDGNVMHPDCANAYYKEDPKKRPVVFLEDNGATCKVKDVSPTQYYERMRHKDAVLDDWSDVEFVNCKEGGKCGRPLGSSR